MKFTKTVKELAQGQSLVMELVYSPPLRMPTVMLYAFKCVTPFTTNIYWAATHLFQAQESCSFREFRDFLPLTSNSFI